jgi:hypothetical protein
VGFGEMRAFVAFATEVITPGTLLHLEVDAIPTGNAKIVVSGKM